MTSSKSSNQKSSSPPECDASTFERYVHPTLPPCTERGEHLCLPRAIRVCAFFDHALVHTKGIYARKPFILNDWQRNDIVGPLMGTVRYSEQYQRYVRRYNQAWIEVARKNGKSELLAGLALYLLAYDGEESAEVYGAAKDREQGRIIWNVAARMCQISPRLNSRKGLRVLKNAYRIIDERTGSSYAVLARDALGNLGLDPYAVFFDEIISQPDGELWSALRTGSGSRPEYLLAAATTAGDDPTSFAANEHAEYVKIIEDPSRAPNRFGYIRTLDPAADPFDEANWPIPNPAYGDFLNMQALKDEAIEARNDPTKENSFRQFRCNQWVSQATRWMPMHVYRECVGDIWPNVDWGLKLMQGREVWCGLDLSAKQDLTSLCVFVPPRGEKPGHAMWWHWVPEDAFLALDSATSHQATQWVRQGFLRLMSGGVIDYKELCQQIAVILKDFKVREIDYDKWSGEFVRQELERLLGKAVPLVATEPTFIGMTVPMTELMSLTVSNSWEHHGNPVATFCFDSVEVKRAIDNPDLIKPVKPQRVAGAARIDAVITTALAVGAWRQRGAVPKQDRRMYSFRGR